MLGRRASRLAPPRHYPWRLSPPQCAAWHRAHTLRVLHAAACQRGLPARGTVRGRIAHPARWSAAGPPGSRRHYPRNIRARITHDHGARALPGRRDGDIAPYRHYPRALPTRITHAHYPWGLPTARRGSRPPGRRNKIITRENRTPTTPRRMVRAEAHRLAHRHQCTIGKHPPTKAPARTAPSAAHCCN